MAIPVLANTTSVAGGFNGTSVAVPVPGSGSVVADDVMLVFGHIESDTAVTLPTGFAQLALAEQNDVDGTHRHYCWWKRTTGADSGNYTFQPPDVYSEWVAHRITGCITSGNPWDVTDTDLTINSTTSVLSFTTTVDETLIIAVGSVFNTGADFTDPDGAGTVWTETFDGDVMASSWRDFATAGATGNVTLTVSGFGSWWTSIMVAMKPPTGAASGHPTMRRWGGVPYVGGLGVSGPTESHTRFWGRAA